MKKCTNKKFNITRKTPANTGQHSTCISDTTTTSTTTTTLRYRKFIEDGRNVAWVSASAVIIAAIIVALGYVIYTCEGDQGCSQFSRNLYAVF
ncbi:hypothetical protein DPMN_185411 [Dreissena polymorpha]|uniref:Uncharacterized protein n=1 Tax=Dreissena polymorpha TaxID=45954 RepID=A0A9D4DM61_DREPO|nr:hypothetical protein DPMN_185411 [Dreissena polymorpha]